MVPTQRQKWTSPRPSVIERPLKMEKRRKVRRERRGKGKKKKKKKQQQQ